MSDTVSVHAAGRGNPTINLSDGREVLTSYVGPQELRSALDQNLAAPLSLASADFDEDGVPDLVSGYSYNGQGIVSLLRGNVDAIYPNAPEAKQRKAEGAFTDAPFLSPAAVFAAPVAADFIGAGDFDGDSHWDVVVGSRMRRFLFLFSGDGHGGFAVAQEIALPGVVTAMTTGEINRRDGLTDIVVGVDGPEGSTAMVFEGPDGALRSEPEVFFAPAVITSLALGYLDDDPNLDLAFAAGKQLTLVQGRDRKLSLDEEIRSRVTPAKTDRHLLASKISALAVREISPTDLVALTDDGSLTSLSWNAKVNESQPRIQTLSAGVWPGAKGLVSTHISTRPGNDLLVLDPGAHQVHIVPEDEPGTSKGATAATLISETEAVALLPMRLNSDALSDVVTLSRNRTAPSVMGTSPASTFVVTNTNNSGTGSLRQAILDANANPGADTITFSIGSGVQTISVPSPVSLPTITDPVTIDGTTQPGFAGKPLIVIDGVLSTSGVIGLYVTAGNCVLRGLVIQRFGNKHNPFAFNSAYAVVLQLHGNNLIEGNFFGTDPTGLIRQGNQFGVVIDADSGNNTVGGTVAAARNIISGGYFGNGMYVGGDQTLIQGNFLGLDADGANAIENEGNGIGVNSSNNTIGGTTAGARNIISGNVIPDIAIYRSGTASQGNLVQGNFIGTDVSGTRVIRNTNTEVFNRIGLILGGADQGLAANNTVGGTTASARNIISGHVNGGIGVFNNGTTNNLIQGNYIGVNISGSLPIGNSVGILATDAPGNTIGGSVGGARNTIAGNVSDGVELGPFNFVTKSIGGSGVTVQGNNIGTDASGTICIGNGRDGVFVELESLIHIIKENVIGCNGRNGVNIPDVTGNSGTPGVRIFIDSNSVFDNAALGIDLGPSGVTLNDLGDGDVGANLLQNFPVLTAADPVVVPEKAGTGASGRHPEAGGRVTNTLNVKGTLNSTPNTTYTIHWYFSTDVQCAANQEATKPLASGKAPPVTTDGNGNASFSFPFDFPSGTTGGIINCTATDPTGNTSEFSSCFKVGGVPAPSPTPTPIASPTPTPPLTPPANNNFAQAQFLLGNNGATNGSNIGATKETGEWDHANNTGGRSVWYRWQPSVSGSATLTTMGSSFDTLMAIYTGSSVSTVARIAYDDDVGQGTLTSTLTFDVVAGTEYRIAVDGYGGVSGNVTLNWNLSGSPSPTPSPTPNGCSTVTFTPNQPIPENNPAGVNIPLVVSGLSGSITDLNIRLDSVAHTYVGDLKFMLTAPNGTSSAVFVDRPGVPLSAVGCFADNFTNTVLDDEAGSGSIENICANGMTGTFTPNNPLTVFDGLNPNGSWTLSVSDLAPGDTGTVQSVSLIICTSASPAKTIQFSSATYAISETGPRVDVTVTRSGDTTSVAAVNYVTNDGAGLTNCDVINHIASPRCDYTNTGGTLQWAAGDATAKSFSIAIVDDGYAEGNETFTASLNSPSGATVGAQSTATVTITDNEATNGTNPIDNTNFFVRQQYIDFLGREPDPPGFAGWTSTINNCSGDTTQCDRIHVSQLFFQSEEFQSRGYFVYRFYPVAFGRKPDYSEFVADLARVSGFLDANQLEAAKVQFITDFMARAAFVSTYNSLNNTQYVDTLLNTAGVTSSSRQTMIDGLNNATKTRGAVLRQIVESPEVAAKYNHQAYSVLEYFGYLRRQPDGGYLAWIAVLDGSNDPRGMVTGFVNSIEYRNRFGP